MGQEQDTPWIL
nr:RecName: Full=Putative protein PB1-F2 [Influenza A virus (A/swine/Wisconsin/1/1967(H1N1))]